MQRQLRRAVRADQARLHIKDVGIQIAEFEVVVGVLLSVEADVDCEYFGRGVRWNDAGQRAVLQHLGWHDDLVAELVLEFNASSVAVVLANKIVAADDQRFVLWITCDDVRGPDLADERTLEYLDCMVQILPILSVR